MSNVKAPEIFQKPLAEIDPAGLPAVDEPGFADAVIARYALHYAAKGWHAAVTVDKQFVRVVAIPEQGVPPKKYVIGLLQNGFLEDALPILEALHGMLDDADIAYNYGICLSELGRTEACLAPLQRCLELDERYINAYVGLGVAYARLNQHEKAAKALKTAVSLEPKNVHAKLNLAATLARAQRHAEALPYFRQSVTLAPNDPAALLGLAQCLEEMGGENRGESNKVYAEIARRFDNSPIAEAAKKALNRIANEQLHEAADGKPRMDAVFYMQGAMDHFAGKPKQAIGQIVMEIALLGQKGLQINNPDKRYTLKGMAGEFSGLQLVSIMHTGIRLLDPKADTGTGLDREYELALTLHNKQT